MKTFLSTLIIVYTVAISGQNEENYNFVLQQVRMDNNIRIIKDPIITEKQEDQASGNESNIQTSQLRFNSNIIISPPSFNFNRHVITQEKINPEKVKDFRIKARNSSSGSISHKPKKVGKSFKKKVLKPMKYWMKRTFKRTDKFQLSCECFKF